MELLSERLNSGDSDVLNVIVELGLEGGRCGVRTAEELNDVIAAADEAAPALRLVGVAGFEGILDVADPPAVDRFVGRLIEASRRVRAQIDDTVLISAGGSIFFDRVVEGILEAGLADTRVLLRSGAYVTHDDGYYARSSPFTIRHAARRWTRRSSCGRAFCRDPNVAVRCSVSGGGTLRTTPGCPSSAVW